MSLEKAKQLIDKLNEVDIDEKDLKTLALQILYDIEGNTAQHAKAKIEALRLLTDITIKKKKEEEDQFGNDAILKVLAGGKS